MVEIFWAGLTDAAAYPILAAGPWSLTRLAGLAHWEALSEVKRVCAVEGEVRWGDLRDGRNDGGRAESFRAC